MVISIKVSVSISCSEANAANNITDDNMLVNDMMMLVMLMMLGSSFGEWPSWHGWPRWHRHFDFDVLDKGDTLLNLFVFFKLKVKVIVSKGFGSRRGSTSGGSRSSLGSSSLFVQLKKIAIDAIIVIVVIVLTVGTNNN